VESLVEAAAVLCDGEGAVIGLSAYLAVSMLWGLARIIYYWWTGPAGGRFPPDVFLTEWVVTMCRRLVMAVRQRLSQAAAVRAGGARADNGAMTSAVSVADSSSSDDSLTGVTGLRGPAFWQTARTGLSLEQASPLQAVVVAADKSRGSVADRPILKQQYFSATTSTPKAAVDIFAMADNWPVEGADRVSNVSAAEADGSESSDDSLTANTATQLTVLADVEADAGADTEEESCADTGADKEAGAGAVMEGPADTGNGVMADMEAVADAATGGQPGADTGAAADATMQSAAGAEGQADSLPADGADSAELSKAGSAVEEAAAGDGVSISSKGNTYL
jgi:hypothetical protein